jgi:alkylhydroperoxidase/carboxymuconolactone decarboxylase family protein YurZ
MANTSSRSILRSANRRLASALLLTVGIVAGCGGTKNQGPVSIAPLVPASVRAAGVPAPDIEELLAQMSLAEKVGQMTQASKAALRVLPRLRA